MSFTSCWRLVSSAESAEVALSTGRSLVAGLLMGETEDIAVSPYFKGGFKVEFRLAHEGTWTEIEAKLLAAFDRVCGEWLRTGDRISD